MLIDGGAAVAAAIKIAKRSDAYRMLRPRVLSAAPVEAWVESCGIAFVGFSMRPVAGGDPGSNEFFGAIVAFAIDLLHRNVVSAQLAELDTSGQVRATHQLFRAPGLFALAFSPR